MRKFSIEPAKEQHHPGQTREAGHTPFGKGVFAMTLVAASFLSGSVFAATPARGLISLRLQGAGNGAIASGACKSISCKSDDACACLTATYSLVGNEDFKGGILDLRLSIDSSNTDLQIAGLGESCRSAGGSGTIRNRRRNSQLVIGVSGLECPTLSGTEVFHGTYVITGGSGKYSVATRGTGMISGSQVVTDPLGEGAARVAIAGSVQPDAPASFTPTPAVTPTAKPTPMVTPKPTPVPTSVINPTPAPTAAPATPTPTPTRQATPAASPTPVAGCFPTYVGTPQGNDAGFFTAITVPAVSTKAGCFQVAFVQTDNPGTNYTGYPPGWTPVYQQGGPEQSEIIVHQNGPSEPAANLWTIAGTVSEVYELNISAICNTSGFDGAIVAYSTTNATSMSVGPPSIGSSGKNNLTLAFSNMPWNSIVTMAGSGDITGFYTSVPSLGGYWYAGVPQNLLVGVVPTTPAFEGDGVSFQASFAPGNCETAGTNDT